MRLEDIEKSQYWLDTTKKKSEIIFRRGGILVSKSKRNILRRQKAIRRAECVFERRGL